MKDIPGYEGLYAITSCGKVWGHKRKHFLIPSNDNGYMRVSLSKKGKVKRYSIHRLVAITYIPNPEDLPEVNQKSEDKTNNCINNLEWVTKSENCVYGTRNKRITTTKLQKTNGDINKKLKKPVYCVELDKEFDSAKTASEVTGVDASNIGMVCRGKRQTAGGYHWRFC